MDTYERCENKDIFPHFNSSLFNTIMMAIFFSQNSRRLLLSESSKLNKIFNSLVNAYYSGKGNIQKILSQISPDEILMKILFETDKERQQILKRISSINQSSKTSSSINFFIWDILFLRKFYEFLGINCMSMAYIKGSSNDKCLLNFDDIFKWDIKENGSFEPILKVPENSEVSTPDVIIVYHSDLYNPIGNLKRLSRNEFKGFRMNTNDERIDFNGETYVLDSVVLNSSTVGITDENTKKVFNSWKLNNYQLSVPCSLKTYDWDVRKDETFCFNPYECELDLMRDIDDISDLCFNFGKGLRTLIYIRENKLKEVSDELLKRFKTKKEILQYPNIQIKIEEIKQMNKDDLISAINELSPKEQITPTDTDKYNKQNLQKRYLEIFLEKNSTKLSKPINELILPNQYLLKDIPKENIQEPPKIQEDDEIKEMSKTGGNYHLSRKKLLQILKRNPKNKGLSSLNKDALLNIYSNNLRNRT